jgi:SAM-dependent methyltransferase
MNSIEARLLGLGDFAGVSVDGQLQILRELASFELGRFLLVNRGLDAYWTHQLVTHRPGAASANLSALERRLFESLPTALATRERFHNFQRQLQDRLTPGILIASVPCGLMGELLLLDYADIKDFELVGVDLDQRALDGAVSLAKRVDLERHVSLQRSDAWSLKPGLNADIVTSNGLNIYEPDDARVTALYRAFFDALRPGGTLITSFLTPPPTLSTESPWRLDEIDHASLAFQQLLFVRIIEAKWSAFRTHATTLVQLTSAGFGEIEFIDDRARMFPTVVARRLP